MQFQDLNKALILPILALIALFVKTAFKVELGNEDMNVIADGILAIVALVGIFTHPRTPPAPPAPPAQ